MELELKKSLIRTISHEIRTPLTTAHLGLKLIRKDIKKTKSVDLIETVDMASMSTLCALDLANEILQHDKLKEGNLVFEKSPCTPWSLLQKAVQPFEVQVCQELVFIACIRALDFYKAFTLLLLKPVGTDF